MQALIGDSMRRFFADDADEVNDGIAMVEGPEQEFVIE